MSLRDEVSKWTSEALRTLEMARHISSLAHASLESTADTLTETLPRRITEAVSGYETLLKQHASTMLATKSAKETVLQITDGHDNQVGAMLQPALMDLDTALASLHSVEVPSFLIKGSEKDSKNIRHLDDFVALEDISKLRKNIDTYLSTCNKVGTLLRKTLHELVHVSDLKHADYKKLSRAYETQILSLKPLLKYSGAGSLSTKTPSDLIGTILKENNALVLELTSLLEMLTRHYDQCTLAQDWIKGGSNEASVDIDVLRSDTTELPAVLQEVRAIYSMILHNEKKAATFAALKRTILDTFIDQSQRLLGWCTDFEANDVTTILLMVFQGKPVYEKSSLNSGNSEPLKNSHVEEYAKLVTELSDHYRQFHAVYQTQYLNELHYEQYVYPRKFLKVLDDCLNGQLLRLEEEERGRRREWLRKYGDFIPGDFELPGEYDQPRVVQVVSKGMHRLQNSSVQDDEDRLVTLLRKGSQ